MIASTPSYSSTRQDIAAGKRAEHERTYLDRLHRQLSQAIDGACDQVEQANLTGGGPCPAAAGALIAQLQLMAGEAVSCPESSLQAHDELFRLSSVLLGRPEGDMSDAELVAER